MNGVTSAQAPADLLPNQAAFNFGANHTSTTGDMAVWENIDPGTDGTIVISCTQYSGFVPGGSSTANVPPYGYAVTGFSLEEISGNSFPLVSITSPTNNQFIIGPANITLNADASDTGGSVTRVEFYQGTTKLGEDATNPYSLTWSNVVPGSYALRAVATDNSGLISTSAVVNVTVITNTPPVVSLTAPTNNQSFVAPANLTITADASDFAGTVTKVEFYQGVTKLGEDTTSPFSFTWDSIGAGSYALTAVATDNSSATSTSAVVNITVISNSPPVVSITSPTNNSAFPASANITISVNASDDGAIGKVEFYSDGIKLGEDLTSPYSFAWLSAPSGPHALMAVATDNLNSTATSAVVNITIVGNLAPSVSITNPPNNALLNAPTNLTISATASDSDGAVSLVEFYAGTTKLGQAATGSPYNFTWTNSLLGTYALTAVATDNGGLARTSAPVETRVTGPEPTKVTLTGAEVLARPPLSVATAVSV